ncbi:uncharacterized protein TRUGW13939_07155 [Talaromyces rugulosus]|uniref:CREG-like beta-barrel domain-containing protein n=1 Tax=Talaromyces rugulosus TaxID=121627 RepID=A0A7H8R575_TALRU|nr:uncharacterized protein TRUGW13939_07155 [Talaromyces rugulosus]QKX60013.1 hypothetical protein TRUGW13939_07155 [Talaromyces rugulosus]
MARLPGRLIAVCALFAAWTSAVPLVIVEGNNNLNLQQQQAILNEDSDPLKDYVSDVANDKELSSPPPPSSDSVKIPSSLSSLLRSSLHHIVDESPSINTVINLFHEEEEDDDEDREENTLIRRPSWFTSTLMARRLLALSSIGVASSVYQTPSRRGPAGLEGVSVSLPEYIADCASSTLEETEIGNGNPVLLGLYVSTTFQNAASGSNVSLSIDWWDHIDRTEPLYPGFPLSAAGLPRVSLLGYIERIPFSSSSVRKALEECFTAAHPDAQVWLPGNTDSPHSGFWARLVVTQAYWIGGFGDTQQIGWINMTEWREIGRESSPPGIGDGRGWEDVRLPGEGHQ